MSDSSNNENENRDERPMWDMTCSNCGNTSQVPFKPEEGRPVYCQDCYRQMRSNRNRY